MENSGCRLTDVQQAHSIQLTIMRFQYLLCWIVGVLLFGSFGNVRWVAVSRFLALCLSQDLRDLHGRFHFGILGRGTNKNC